MVLNNSQFPHHLDADCDGVTFVCDAKRWEVSSKQARHVFLPAQLSRPCSALGRDFLCVLATI